MWLVSKVTQHLTLARSLLKLTKSCLLTTTSVLLLTLSFSNWFLLKIHQSKIIFIFFLNHQKYEFLKSSGHSDVKGIFGIRVDGVLRSALNLLFLLHQPQVHTHTHRHFTFMQYAYPTDPYVHPRYSHTKHLLVRYTYAKIFWKSTVISFKICIAISK